MSDAILLQTHLEKGWLIPLGSESVGKFGAIVRLEARNGAGEGFHKVFHKQGRGIGVMFLKGFHKAPSGILVNGCILEEMFADHAAVYQAGRRDKFDIHLDTLAGMVHLLIRLGDIFGVRRVDWHNAVFFEETVEAGKRAGIAALHEFNPENDESCMGITPAHIGNQFNFVRGMLVGVVVRSAGKVAQRLKGAVEAPFPAVNILPVGFKFDGSFRNSIFLSEFNKG